MRFVFSNILSIVFCKNFLLQFHNNSNTFLKESFFVNDNNSCLLLTDKSIVSFYEAVRNLFVEKLPLITENGGIFSHKVR